MRIALAGNPNSGKTTMYNALTGKNEKVGNWAGVTVEKKESTIKRRFYKNGEKLTVVDLPGAYSMSAFTAEESITSTYIKNEDPDVIINIVDATNLGRSLFFTTQLLELQIPVVVALNKSDINAKKETEINVKLLSERLGCPVIETVSTIAGKNGLDEVVNVARSLCGKGQQAPCAVETSDKERFAFVNEIVKEVEVRKVFTNQKSVQDKIDEILMNKWVGIPIFALVMFLVFYISQSTLGTWIADWLSAGIALFQDWVARFVVDASPFMQALLLDGIIGGVGAVLGFLPLVMLMYFLIALLEDCGYMARATVVLDPIFKKVGLSGKSVIPMVVGTGCAVPGVMACRTIRDERERRATAMLAPFMPCGAKLPVIALFVGAFFPKHRWIGTAMYFVGILIILFGALLVKKITGRKAKKSFFIIELPEYKWPSIKRATFSMLSRGKSYIIKAGTIILVCNVVVQIMATFNWRLENVGDSMSESILATIASPVGTLLVPIAGVAAWQLAAAAITGFVAKENVVGTLAVAYGMTNLISTEALEMVEGAGSEVANAMGLTTVAALSYMMFNLFSPPCFAALGAMRAEMQSGKWFWAGVFLQLGTGYVVAFIVYQVGTLFITGRLGAGFIPGLLAVLAMAAIVLILVFKGNREEKV